jgi:hypothetical protein
VATNGRSDHKKEARPVVTKTIPEDVQELIEALQQRLGLSIWTGQILLNLNERTLQSVETKTYLRVRKETVVTFGA